MSLEGLSQRSNEIKVFAHSMGYSLLPSPDVLLEQRSKEQKPCSLSLSVSVEADGESSSGPRDSGLLWCHQPPPQQGGPGKSQEQLQRPDVQADRRPVCAVSVDRWTILPREDQEGKPFLPGPSSQTQHFCSSFGLGLRLLVEDGGCWETPFLSLMLQR